MKKNKTLTFGKWLEVWIDTYKKPYLAESSIKRLLVSVRNHVPQWLKDKRVTEITAFDLDRAVANCALPRSRKYVYHILHNSLHRAYCLDVITTNVASKMTLIRHRQKRGQSLTHEEQRLFLKAVANTPYFNAFKFLLLTGVRRGELTGLKFDDVQHTERLIKINGTKTETSDRFILLTDELEGIITEQRKRHPDEEFVFPYNADALTHLFKHVCPNHKLHDLRHTFITRCAESGININVTQNLVGHKTLNTTLSVYTHISIDFARSEFAKFKA